MVTVDSKGRIVLPQEVRESLGIAPGTEVEITEEEGKAVVKPERDPEEIIDRLEQLVADTAPQREEPKRVANGVNPITRKHRDAVRRGAKQAADPDE